MSYFIDGTERVNKTALLLAQERYSAQYAPFVKSAARLSYLSSHLDRLITEVCEEVGAERDWVENRFLSFVHDSVHYKQDPDGLPSGRNEDTYELSDVHKTDPMDRGEVPGAGREEAINQATKVDLDKESCFRCGTKLASTSSPVCPDCTQTLKRLADSQVNDTWGDPNGPTPVTLNEQQPTNIDLPYRCKICGAEGTQGEIAQHISRDHASVLERGQQFAASTKESEAIDPDTTAEVQPMPESPADRFDTMVVDLANRAAAEQFSSPDDHQISLLAQQLGVDPQAVKESLVTVATFGNYTGVNGQLNADTNVPDGYEEVSQDLSAQANTQKALVPTDMVITSVADQMAMKPELAYQMVKDRYGDDLPDKYHAPVNGDIHYYLPTSLAGDQSGAQQAQQEQQQQMQQPQDVGPAAQPAPDTTAPAQ